MNWYEMKWKGGTRNDAQVFTWEAVWMVIQFPGLGKTWGVRDIIKHSALATTIIHGCKALTWRSDVGRWVHKLELSEEIWGKLFVFRIFCRTGTVLTDGNKMVRNIMYVIGKMAYQDPCPPVHISWIVSFIVNMVVPVNMMGITPMVRLCYMVQFAFKKGDYPRWAFPNRGALKGTGPFLRRGGMWVQSTWGRVEVWGPIEGDTSQGSESGI